MANVRNQNQKIVENDVRHYKKLVGRRGVKKIDHYGTPTMRHPSVSQRARIPTTSHVWSTGDRFYKLANKYYGDVKFWWVIAWWNGVPTEANINYGDLIDIPLDLVEALRALGI
jgi:hypothetical protein